MSEAANLPTHVGLILDGNRRWARAQNIPTLEGHRAGYANLKTIVKHAINQGVKYISAYIFSAENWQRSKDEVKYLLDLALWVATKEVQKIHKENIRVVFLGRQEGLSKNLIEAIQKAEELTKDNTRGTLALCFNYGGQQEIVDAANATLEKGGEITAKSLSASLYAPEIPAVDLIIRTSGEQRLSNFMLWRAAYAELYFIQKHWPAFTVDDFDEAMAEFAARHRRFGS